MSSLLPDEDACYRAVSGRDGRFDGWIYVGVTSTGIYCRPSCPATIPARANCRFFATAGAAQGHGFRACRRCRPDAVPGSPLWHSGSDVAARAMRLIGDGLVDREGVAGLARRLGYSERQVHRVLVEHAGSTPIHLARAQRAHAARILLEGTTMAISDVAFAAGFGSIRQFNDTVRAVFARTPLQMREEARRRHRVPGQQPSSVGRVSVHLPFRGPLAREQLFRHLARHAVPGVESSTSGSHAVSVRLAHGVAAAAIRHDGGGLRADLAVTDWRDLVSLIARVRRMLDLDADSVAIDAALSQPGTPVSALVAHRPGVRLPGSIDPRDQALRTVVGQQVSVRAALAQWGSIVTRVSTGLPAPLAETVHEWGHELSHLPPEPEAVASLEPASLPMPRSRGRCLVRLGAALAAGELDLGPGCDRRTTRAQLEALPGIGAWSSGHIAIGALGDPDVDLVSSDLVARRAARGLRLTDVARYAPWRSYLTQHLWLHALEPTATHPRHLESA